MFRKHCGEACSIASHLALERAHVTPMRVTKKRGGFVDDLVPAQNDPYKQVEVLTANRRCADSEVLIKAIDRHQRCSPEGSARTGAENADCVRVERMVEAMSISIPDQTVIAFRKPAELVNEELC